MVMGHMLLQVCEGQYKMVWSRGVIYRGQAKGLFAPAVGCCCCTMLSWIFALRAPRCRVRSVDTWHRCENRV